MSFHLRPQLPVCATICPVTRQTIFRSRAKRFNSTTAHLKEKLPRRAVAPSVFVAAAVLGAVGGAYYYRSSLGTILEPTLEPTFSLTYTFRSGNKRDYTFEWLPESTTAAMLHEHESSQVINRPGNPVIRWDRNWVGSNEPCEDRSAIDLLPRKMGIKPSTGKVGEKDLMLFSVIDGHAGWATSDLLEKIMHPTMVLGLAGLQAGVLPNEGYMKTFAKNMSPRAWAGSMWTPENIMTTLRESCAAP